MINKTNIDDCWLNSGYKDIIWAITYRVLINFTGHVQIHPVTFDKVRSHDEETLIERFETIVNQFTLPFTYEYCKNTDVSKYRPKEIKQHRSDPYLPFHDQWIGDGDYYSINLPDDFQNNYLRDKKVYYSGDGKILKQTYMKDPSACNRFLQNPQDVYEKITLITEGNLIPLSYRTKTSQVIDVLKHSKRHFTYCGSTAWIGAHMNTPQTIISQNPQHSLKYEVKYGNYLHVSENEFLNG